MLRQIIETDQAPQPLGAYSQGVIAQGRFIFISGQVGIDPMTRKLVDGGIEAQTRQALQNLNAVLEGGNAMLRNVIKTTILLQNISDFKTVNAIYDTFFPDKPPARSTFGGLELPYGALVEIECIAVLPA
jgi:2-iminobutanoate/2-iminopropanoate deaminase